LVYSVSVAGIRSFLGELFKKILPYLVKGARAIGEEALHAGIYLIVDVKNNTTLKGAIKTRFKE